MYIIIYLRGFADLETPTRLCAIHRASQLAQMIKKKKKSACNAGDPGLIPGFRSSPEEGNSNPLQYSCLENSMDGGTWRATVQGSQRVGYNLATKQQQDKNIHQIVRIT